MDCKHHQQDISQMIDNELDDITFVGLLSHMSDCPECREFYRSVVKLRSFLLGSDDFNRLTTGRENKHVGEKPTRLFRGTVRLSKVSAFLTLIIAITLSTALSYLWLTITTDRMEKEVEYILTYPPIQVSGYYSNVKQQN